MRKPFSDYVRSHLFELSISGSTLSACLGYAILLDVQAPVWLNLMTLGAFLLVLTRTPDSGAGVDLAQAA